VANKFEVTGYDKEGRKVFRLNVEAPSEIVGGAQGADYLCVRTGSCCETNIFDRNQGGLCLKRQRFNALM
jgi:hypothetical protein